MEQRREERQELREERRQERRAERDAFREGASRRAQLDQRRLDQRRSGVFRDRRPGYLPRDRYGNRRPSRGGWLVAIVLLVVLALVLWFFLSRGTTGSIVTPAEPTQSLNTPAPQTITSDDGQDVLALAADPAALAGLEDHTVSALDVTVQSVVSEQGVWVGPSQAQRIFVAWGGQSIPTGVGPGDVVSFSGVLNVLPVDFQTRFGVDDAEGATFLQQQGHYIDTTSVSLANGT
jgi:hypothetical protein